MTSIDNHRASDSMNRVASQFDADTDGCIIATATWQRDMIAHGATQWRALSLLAGTALMVASKYEENQNIQVIDWDLGVPGPLPFLQHFIHERRMRPEAAISGNETNEQYENHHSNQEYTRKRASTSNEALVQVVAESCIRIAMTQHDVAWYDSNVMAGICYQLALYVVQSAKPDGYKDLFTEHDARMIYLASRTKLIDIRMRAVITNSQLLHSTNTGIPIMDENLVFHCNDFTDPDTLTAAMAIWKATY
ncbi:hypothetical protein IWW34DRAFT_641872 [Fusarium oxysporum f. sp. albedinis]|uniref:Uncharacterized protein n=1 Tax=Fusarium oxysporum (strain Fo5176) TaxID=660025 RepID=F9GGG8_FUSOF|nr:hypothetical protein FOXB_17752 [Fusarium oxysporum f. sp. conglutinans Fo5176]KAI3564277.1 hypothetical protein IWW34DRAFT_642293 [Fusarium oxysporum f. sp. albedinis]KAI3565872.1 hypothetical protein IWW34DRAFT_641872 [Fusarium oxysporum f. sp. albedinis]